MPRIARYHVVFGLHGECIGEFWSRKEAVAHRDLAPTINYIRSYEVYPVGSRGEPTDVAGCRRAGCVLCQPDPLTKKET